MKKWLVPIASILLFACSSGDLPTEPKSENGHYQVVVEIPAGDTELWELNMNGTSIEPVGAYMDFLPFPGNYGYIPGTSHPESDKGTGAALDALVLSPRLERGSVIEVMPIAMLKLQRSGRFENKVIAVPVDSSLNPLNVKNYYELQRDHYLCKNILMEWFLHLYESDSVIFIGWENEKVTMRELERRRSY